MKTLLYRGNWEAMTHARRQSCGFFGVEGAVDTDDMCFGMGFDGNISHAREPVCATPFARWNEVGCERV